MYHKVLGTEANRNVRSISSLANELAVTTRAIRFYEESGLIVASRAGSGMHGGMRHFDSVEVDKLKFIVKLRNLGVSVSDILGLLQIKDEKEFFAAVKDAVLESLGRLKELASIAENILERV